MTERVNVTSEQEAMSRGIGDWMLDLIRGLVGIGHTRGWGTFSAYLEKDPVPKRPNGFAFITWDAEMSRRAQEALKEAGLLCDHNLENPPPRQYCVQNQTNQVSPKSGTRKGTPLNEPPPRTVPTCAQCEGRLPELLAATWCNPLFPGKAFCCKSCSANYEYLRTLT